MPQEERLPAHVSAAAVQHFARFYTEWRDVPDHHAWFRGHFGVKLAPALYFKFLRSGFTAWFLGLGHRYQTAFLGETCGRHVDLPGAGDIRERYRVLRYLPVEELRGAVTGFSALTEWDVFAQDLVWIRRFCLYARDNDIVDGTYTGGKCGTLDNWAAYYLGHLGSGQKVGLMGALAEQC